MRALLLLAQFVIAPAPDSRFELEMEKTGLLSGKKHLFTFDKYRGTFDGKRIEFVVDATSIQLHDDWSPAKGKEAEIIEVAKKEIGGPEIRFVAENAQEGTVTGQLTIRGITKPCAVTVKRNGNTLEGSATIKHADYGLKPQKAALGAIGTKEEMLVRFRLTATPRSTATPK